MGQHWRLYFDGACAPFNPGGIATYGFWLTNTEGTHFMFEGKGLAAAGGKEATNNVAEYMGLLKGLAEIDRLIQKGDRLEIFGDSQLVIRQLTGQYAVNAPHLKPLHQKAALAIHSFRMTDRPVDLTWIPREKNTTADRLSNEAIKEAGKADPEILKKLILPFGKHVGMSLYDVPEGYYNWLWTNKGGELLIPHRQT